MKTKVLACRVTAMLLAALLVCLSFASADAEEVGTLAVSYPVDGTVFHIYSVGSLKNGEIVMDTAFKYVDTSDYAAAASTMADMIRRGGVCQELASATVADGKAVFQNLPMAVYLVLGDPSELDGVRYWPTPFLLSVPQKDDAEQFLWDVSVSGKKEMDMEISVVKRWVGDIVIYRPTGITVRLMHDGKIYGNPVVLNYTNNWSYMWENLPPDNWYVTEDPSPRYTTTITREGNTFIITNTWKKIPQTGQLWWPVSALALTGLVFICLGLLRRRNDHA